MRIGVVHHDFDAFGGGEQVALHAIKAFHDHGHKVIVSAISYPDLRLIKDRFDLNLDNCIENFISTRENIQRMPFLIIYQVLLQSPFSVGKMLSTETPDCILLTDGPFIVPKHFADRTAVYVNYPYDHAIYGGKYKSLSWRIYATPARFVLRNLYQNKESLLITNSNFTRAVIKEFWAKDAHVIYPPVPQHTFKLENNRRNDVVSLGRFSREKRHSMILNIAKSLPDINFHLIGSMGSQLVRDLSYLDTLKKSATNNVRFHVNATHAEKQEILRSSKVLLHTMIEEHFGIAIPEAMSAGLIPVVHNSGGAKEDSLVDPEFRFEGDIENVEDARNKVQEAIRRWNIGEANRQREKAKEFSPERFRAEIANFMSLNFAQ